MEFTRRGLFGTGIAGLAIFALGDIWDAESKKRKKRKKKKQNVQRENPPVGCNLVRCSPAAVDYTRGCAKVAAKLAEPFVCRSDPADTRTNDDALMGDDMTAKRQVSCYVSHHLSGCSGNCCTPEMALEQFDTSTTCHPAWVCGGGSGVGNGADG